MLVIISPRSDREATAGTLFQFIVYRNKKGKTRDGLAQSIFITVTIYISIHPLNHLYLKAIQEMLKIKNDWI